MQFANGMNIPILQNGMAQMQHHQSNPLHQVQEQLQNGMHSLRTLPTQIAGLPQYALGTTAPGMLSFGTSQQSPMLLPSQIFLNQSSGAFAQATAAIPSLAMQQQQQQQQQYAMLLNTLAAQQQQQQQQQQQMLMNMLMAQQQQEQQQQYQSGMMAKKTPPSISPPMYDQPSNQNDQALIMEKKLPLHQHSASHLAVQRKRSSPPTVGTQTIAKRPCKDDGRQLSDSILQSMGGQDRLQIAFISLGELPTDRPIQTFGRQKLPIPDGLAGTHRMYSQTWKFEISYTDNSVATSGDRKLEALSKTSRSACCLQWKVTNLISGLETSVTESLQQAMIRQESGRTISNLVMQQAMEERARELERDIGAEENDVHAWEQMSEPEREDQSIRQSSVRAMARRLRPKRCGEGLLFFGLKHDIVQQTHYHDYLRLVGTVEEIVHERNIDGDPSSSESE